ncbi:hypothetical protein A5844_000828 [Enterococcus sp. 10A9_DIV0425]|uniref:Thioredoxin domain-containing protein n=2 Tax=Candidatus Enterococcus wittei TaxID=1987383 RepID=A0A2C9XQW5_9ENTE|nr:hypothetical protein A5844_000828 [Enterococcus sp. 10A9_DIV0425]
MVSKRCKKILLLFLLSYLLIATSCEKEEKKSSAEETAFSNVVTDMEIKLYNEAMRDVNEITLEENLRRDKNMEYQENSYVYFGRATCPICREFVNSVENISGIENLFYIDTDKMSNTDKEKLSEIGITSIPSILKVDSQGDLRPITTEVFLEEVANE